MNLMRWLPTFLAFPAGGLLAMGAVGSIHDPLAAAAGGVLAGAVIGAAQAVALRADVARWTGATAAAMAAGSALAAAVTGGGTELGDLVVTGLIAGATVGAAQGALLGDLVAPARRRPRLVAPAWAVVTAASWGIAWFVTWNVVGVNADQGFAVFGSSGALVATILTGLALRRAVIA
jgi:hypothetical protein